MSDDLKFSGEGITDDVQKFSSFEDMDFVDDAGTDNTNDGSDTKTEVKQTKKEKSETKTDVSDDQTDDAEYDDEDAEAEAEEAEAEDEEVDEHAAHREWLKSQKFTLLVNGKREKVDLEEMRVRAQMQKAGEAKVEKARVLVGKAAEAKKKYEEGAANWTVMLNELGAQPLLKWSGDKVSDLNEEGLELWEDFLESLRGRNSNIPTLHDIAVAFAVRNERLKGMSDSEKADLKIQKEQKKRDREDAKRADAEKAKLVHRFTDSFAKQMPNIVKQVGLPDSPAILSRVADVWVKMIQQGRSPTAQEVVRRVKQWHDKINGGVPQKKELNKPRKGAFKGKAKSSSAQKPQQTKKMNIDEWQKSLNV